MKDTNKTRKGRKIIWRSLNHVFFWTSIFLSLAFFAIPRLLSIPCIYDRAKSFLEYMGPYKASYFEASGAMIGSFLAVISAIWVQNRSEIRQNKNSLKKNAIIVYFDLKKFYEENNSFVIDLNALLQKNTHKQTQEYICKRFIRLKESSSIHIDPNWISTVAELGSELDKKTIDDIYSFYGEVEYIQNKLEKISEPSIEDIVSIHKKLVNIGKFTPKYQPNTVIEDLQNTLDALITRLD